MQIRSTSDLVASIEAQQHRRFFKTHTPLDGIPEHPTVTYLAVFRHPLDVALSNLDHAGNQAEELLRLREAAVGDKDLDELPAKPDRPVEPVEVLRQFVEVDVEPTGSGLHSLSDLCQQLQVAWDRRHRPNVHLLHYADLHADLDGEMRRIADALGIDIARDIGEETWPTWCRPRGFGAMRTHADQLALDAALGIWNSSAEFFAHGGSRHAEQLLSPGDLAVFEQRLDDLAGPAADWLRYGRAGRPSEAEER